MKIRQAKKFLLSKQYRKKWTRLRPPYYDENRKVWVHPSWADIPLVMKAKKRYYKWLRNKKKWKQEK